MARIQYEMEEVSFESREKYVHQACGGVTTVGGGSKRSLACPFEYVSGNYCAACGRVDLVFCFEWEAKWNFVGRTGITNGHLPR